LQDLTPSLPQSDRQENYTYDDQDIPDKGIFDANDVVVFLVKDADDKDHESIQRLGAKRVVEIGARGQVFN
jgi:hypothetical protein